MADGAVRDVAASPIPGPWSELWRAYAQSRGALIGLFLVLALILLAIFADVVSPHPPNEQYREFTLTPPMWQQGGTPRFVLGTDPVGRDMLSRLIHGTRLSLVIGAEGQARESRVSERSCVRSESHVESRTRRRALLHGA